MISAVIVARNEEKHIKRCLESVMWCDEIVVIDNSSSDATGKIAKKLGGKVFEYERVASEGNFGKMREFGVSKTNGEWVLFVDADEQVTKDLAGEIKEIVNNSERLRESAFGIPRKNIFLGHVMRWGGWWPD